MNVPMYMGGDNNMRNEFGYIPDGVQSNFLNLHCYMLTTCCIYYLDNDIKEDVQ